MKNPFYWHGLNSFKFGIYIMFKAWKGENEWECKLGVCAACMWRLEVIALCRNGTSWESPPHLFFDLLIKSHTKTKQKRKIEETLPALTPVSQQFITVKIYSHQDIYLLNQGSIQVASTWWCFATWIWCLHLPSPLNSAHRPTLLEWTSCRG